jgi:hypothetical protein
VREICPSCRGRISRTTDCASLPLRLCRHTIRSFSRTDGSYLCPKCNGRMHHLGTEFDRLGKAFVCRCGSFRESARRGRLFLLWCAHAW